MVDCIKWDGKKEVDIQEVNFPDGPVRKFYFSKEVWNEWQSCPVRAFYKKSRQFRLCKLWPFLWSIICKTVKISHQILKRVRRISNFYPHGFPTFPRAGQDSIRWPNVSRKGDEKSFELTLTSRVTWAPNQLSGILALPLESASGPPITFPPEITASPENGLDKSRDLVTSLLNSFQLSQVITSLITKIFEKIFKKSFSFEINQKIDNLFRSDSKICDLCCQNFDRCGRK